MQQPSTHSPFTLLFALLRSYIAYLISIPAVLLHCIGILIGIVSIYAIGMAILPGVTASGTQTVLSAINMEEFYFAGNPTSHFLKAYAFCGIVLAVLDLVLHRLFGVRIHLTWKQLLLGLSALTLVNYTLAGIIMAVGKGFMFEPLAFLAIITIGATVLAVGAQKVLKK